MRNFAISILLLTGLNLPAQFNRQGIPVLTNYPPELYQASEQNWAIVQDGSGIMYFGNNDYGILEYDGISWRKIPLPGNPIVRSLAVLNDTVYVGAVNEFGYLATAENGQKEYFSLSGQVDSLHRDFADVWKTYTLGDSVFFSTEADLLFVFKNQELQNTIEIPDSPLFTFCVSNRVVAGSYLKGLTVYENGEFKPLPGGEFFTNRAVLSILPMPGPWWQVGTVSDGIFLYQPETGEISTRFPSEEANNFLKANTLYHGISLPGKRYAYATLQGGALVLDSAGSILDRIDKNTGLQNEVVTCLYHNGKNSAVHPLWLALSSGIARAETEIPLRVFDESFGLTSSILDIREFRGVLYLGTLTGLYYLQTGDNNPGHLVRMGAVPHSCWSLQVFRDPETGRESLLAGTQQGVFEITDTGRIRSLEDTYLEPGKYYQCFYLHLPPGKPDQLFLGLKTGVVSLSFQKGKWVKNPSFSTLPSLEIRSMATDRNGTLWASTLGSGVLAIDIRENDTLVRHFGTEHGLASLKNNRLYTFGNRLLLAGQRGMMCFESKTGCFVPDTLFPPRYRDGSLGIHRVAEGQGNDLWMAVYNESRRWLEHLLTINGEKVIDSLPFKTLPGREQDAIRTESGGITWLGISNELYAFLPSARSFGETEYRALIRKVRINADSVLYPEAKAVTGGGSLPEFPYRMNQVGFEFAAPFFIREEATRFSYRLDGLHSGWSAWTDEPRVTFNNLREGRYTFRLRAMNIYGQISPEDRFRFRIIPPWYRSMPAFGVYLLLAGILVLFIVKWNARRLTREKQQLERLVAERTREVTAQKTEIEKQRDLAQRQKKRIENQNRDIKDSIKYARRIQNAILPPEDFLSDFIPECFVMNLPKDIVSGDFYWFSEKNNRLVIAVADCTGHGVPGAFMSMLGMAFLNEIVNKNNIVQPAEILYYLRIYVINSLHQRGQSGETRDGMDISLMAINTNTLELEFAGAFNPLCIIRNGELTVLRGDRMPIGIHEKISETFTNHRFSLKRDDRLYAFSDGYADQFGGPGNKKITSGVLKKWLLEVYGKDMKSQREILENRFLEWKGKNSQVDDILMVGLRI